MATTFHAFYPTATATNASVSGNGSPIPSSSTLVAAEDTGGNLAPLLVDASGNLKVAISAGLANPLPVSQSGTWNINNISGTISLPTGASTETTLVALSAKLPSTLGQKAMAASLAVVLASDQSAIPVSQSGTWNITNISGTVSLPTGAATSAKQPALGTAGSASPDVITVQGIASMTALKVDGSAVTQPISAASLPLPTGAATSANQTTGNTSLATIATNTGNIPAKGQATMANSTPVAIASDQSALPAEKGRSQANAPARNVYSSTNVTTSAFTQLVASLSNAVNLIEVFDSSGQTMAIATGGAGSEVIQAYIFPGGQGQIPIAIAAGTRISIKAISANATSGEIDVNFWS